MTTSDTLDLSTLPFYQWDTAAVVPVQESEEYAGLSMLDSIFAPRMETEVRQHPSMFRGHTLSVTHQDTVARPPQGVPAWTFVALLMLVGLVCLYYRQHKITFSNLVKAVFDDRAMDRLLRGNNLTRTVQLIPMGLLLLAVMALPVTHMPILTQLPSPLVFLLLIVASALAYLLRNVLFLLLGSVFDNNAAVNLYISNNYLFHLLLATVLLPFLFLYFYLPGGSEAVLYILLGITAIEFVLRIFRGMKLFLTQSSDARFYLFYYLCIVEMVPILLLVKFL